ncbi:MAG: hypothetical protein U1E51_36340 [Candidatus Binatia bacterium]|nr:hypothetical protein [Candidatus Binatia bacterium]
MADPVYTLGVEFVAGSFTNLTSLCLQGQVERQLATLFEPPREGHAMFTLVNEDGRFSPQNSASPYYPNLVPGKALKLEATHSGSTYPLFKGRVTNFSVNPMVGDRTMLLEAGDGMNKLVNTFITTSLYVATNARSLFTTLASESLVSSYSVDTDIADAIPFAWFNGEQVTRALERLTSFGNYAMYEDGAGTLRLRSRYWQQGASSVATYAADGTGFDRLEFDLSQESVHNRIKVSGQPRRQRSAVGTVAWLEETLSIPASSGIGFFLDFIDTDDPNTRAPAIDVITPLASVDWFLNTLSGGGGTDRTSTGSLQFTLFGESAVCSLFNGAGDTAYVTAFQVRGNSVQEQPVLSSEFASSSSQNLYGRREFALENDFLSLQSYISGYAEYLLSIRKEPKADIRFGLRNEFPDVLAREVGDIVSVVESISAVNSQWQITALTHEISLGSGLEHATMFTVRQHPDEQWLVLDHATRGKLDSGKLGF